LAEPPLGSWTHHDVGTARLGDAFSSDAIICITRSSAGRHPRARSRPAREEDTGGTESAVSHFDEPMHRAPAGRRSPPRKLRNATRYFRLAHSSCNLPGMSTRRFGSSIGCHSRDHRNRNFRCTVLFATLRVVTSSSPARPRRPAPTTIADIAELTGVSVPTVSKVINGRSDVSAETRRRVETAIRDHGYRRSPS